MACMQAGLALHAEERYSGPLSAQRVEEGWRLAAQTVHS